MRLNYSLCFNFRSVWIYISDQVEKILLNRLNIAWKFFSNLLFHEIFAKTGIKTFFEVTSLFRQHMFSFFRRVFLHFETHYIIPRFKRSTNYWLRCFYVEFQSQLFSLLSGRDLRIIVLRFYDKLLDLQLEHWSFLFLWHFTFVN